MIKKLNKLLTSSIITSLLFLLIGIIIVIYPENSIKVLSTLLAIFLVVNGLYLIVIGADIRNIFFIDFFPTGILSLVLGILMILYPNTLSIIITISLGIWFIWISIFKLRLSISLKNIDEPVWILTIITSILSIICGLILIFNPISSSIAITMFTGAIIIIYAISDLIDMIVFKKNVNKIVKHFKKSYPKTIKIIDEE